MVTRWLHWILLCSWTVCFLVSALPRTSIWAQEGIPGERGVLLLERDRIMQGRITAQKETYQVQQDAAGVVVVPKESVRFQGPDLRSVYVFLLESFSKDATADDHVKLARWCITYKLLPEARFELETALEMDPSREDIRRNISILDSHAKRSPSSAKSTRSLTPAERRSRGYGGSNEDAETLAGLSRETGQVFTTRIQPILVHNCTNAACHGPSAEHSLKFSIVRAGSTASHAVSEKNLMALMKYIDIENPKTSPFWKILTTNHGAQGSSIFTGSKGPQQLRACKDWVRSLSINGDLEEDQPQPAVKKDEDPKSPDGPKSRPNQSKTTAKAASEESTLAPSTKEPRKKTTAIAKAIASTKSKSQSGIKIQERRAPEKIGKSEVSLVASADERDSTEATLPEVEPIIAKTREAVPELPPEDPFDPEIFNRKQRMKRNTYD